MTDLDTILAYFGYQTIEDAEKAFGLFNPVDAERMLREMYDEEMAVAAYYGEV